MEPTKIEYSVRKIERFIVTRYEEGRGAKDANRVFAGSVGKGEYDNAEVAHEVAYALARAEHEALGWPAFDDRIQYPRRIDEKPSQAR